MKTTRDANYLLFSDVHLGADLVQHVRPWTLARLKQIARIDRDLASMLEYYRTHRDPHRPWCLVIAGDLVDFIGMSVAPRPGSPVETALNEDEREHGLGSARDHAAWKMRAVARRHRVVFEHFGRFIADGHRLVLVRGNHDLDFHWDAARHAFTEAVLDHIDGADDPERRQELAGRIEFHPWFYYVEGLLYVEHGHQFDAVCNYPHLLAPLSPADPNRLQWSLSDWLLRAVARPTPGLGSDGHDKRTPLSYLRFAFSLGVLGMVRLAYRYFRALLSSMRHGRHALTESARAVREEHESRMAELASRMRVRLEHLRSLAALWPRPIATRLGTLARSQFFDRIAVGSFTLAAIGVLALVEVPMPIWAVVALAACMLCTAFMVWSRQRRQYEVDPARAMRKAARRIATLLPTRFVVMGHTHQPLVEPVGDGVTYVNLGNWGVDDLDGSGGEAPRTHLVLRWVGSRLRADFLRWDPERGPLPVRRLHEEPPPERISSTPPAA